mmetsp:Transcript_65248/g.187905  ORF Transcript_65248/g.187905 Transcript_65248/m.187905 type:complete len:288 (-) Transcript_65248:203-1066(-)
MSPLVTGRPSKLSAQLFSLLFASRARSSAVNFWASFHFASSSSWHLTLFALFSPAQASHCAALVASVTWSSSRTFVSASTTWWCALGPDLMSSFHFRLTPASGVSTSSVAGASSCSSALAAKGSVEISTESASVLGESLGRCCLCRNDKCDSPDIVARSPPSLPWPLMPRASSSQASSITRSSLGSLSPRGVSAGSGATEPKLFLGSAGSVLGLAAVAPPSESLVCTISVTVNVWCVVGPDTSLDPSVAASWAGAPYILRISLRDAKALSKVAAKEAMDTFKSSKSS